MIYTTAGNLNHNRWHNWEPIHVTWLLLLRNVTSCWVHGAPQWLNAVEGVCDYIASCNIDFLQKSKSGIKVHLLPSYSAVIAAIPHLYVNSRHGSVVMTVCILTINKMSSGAEREVRVLVLGLVLCSCTVYKVGETWSQLSCRSHLVKMFLPLKSPRINSLGSVSVSM